MALHVFPPTVTQPRKSSLKKPRPSNNGSGAAGELKGVAFQVNTIRNSPGVVQPGNQQIKHSLFCEPRTSTPDIKEEEPARVDTPLAEDEDELSALPENNNFGTSSSQTRLKPGVERPKLPILISTEAQPDTDTPISPGGDGLSPLPHKIRFTPTSPSRTEFPMARSVVSNSPTLVQGDSPETLVPQYNADEVLASSSLFPRYDHRKPLDQQHYYPRNQARSTTPTLPREKVSKVRSNSDEKKLALPALNMTHVENSNAVVVGYEHIPIAHPSDLHAVCNASCGNFPVAGRKALFRLIQTRGKGTSLGIGLSPDALLYSMDKQSASKSAKGSSDELHIKKHSPESAASYCTVAQLVLPDSEETNKPGGNDVVSIFPQMAAFNAIETITNSPVGAEIAKVDPIAASPEAARMAQDAVWEAHRRYRSLLVRTTRKRDSLGAVTATYKLEHPTLSAFPITVTRSTNGRHPRDPRAKISLHHPSATPAAVEAETLVLGFLDFANDACVLDIPGLLALEGSYVLDTIVCALLTVAMVENDALMAETVKFDPPPTSPQPLTKRGSGNEIAKGKSKDSKRSSGFWRKDKKKMTKKQEYGEDDLPSLTRGALTLLGMSFKMAIWTLELSAKIGVGLIVATSEVIRQKD